MASRILFITGTDTGVGKTVFAVLVTLHLRDRGIRVAALKPICSGGRDDARLLRDAAGRVLSLDEVNPWHFRARLSPLLAARKDRKRVSLDEVVAHVRAVGQRHGRTSAIRDDEPTPRPSKEGSGSQWIVPLLGGVRGGLAGRRIMGGRFDVIVVEGAGGLLSPLGEAFDSRDLIQALGATPIIVCPNELGAVNQVRLTVSALPRAAGRRARIVLVNPARPDVASRMNLKLLGEFVNRKHIRIMPWLGGKAALR